MRVVLCSLISILSLNLTGQSYQNQETGELNIPSSPSFAMLGVNPETVLKPADIRSFKVDWRIKNYVLAPDFALEIQPLWHFLYRKRSPERYNKQNMFFKKLSTISTSMGIAKVDGINHAAYAVKVNLYAKGQKNSEKEILKNIQTQYDDQLKQNQKTTDSLIEARFKTTNPEKKIKIQEEIDLLSFEREIIIEKASRTFKEELENLGSKVWNRTMLDFSFGRVFTYDNAGFDSLKVKKAGLGIWLNGSLGIGKDHLITGLIRMNAMYEKQNILLGLSYCFGNPKYNFYVETFGEKLENYYDDEQEAPFVDQEYIASKFSLDLGTGWVEFNNTDVLYQYSFVAGGDFKLNRKILLNFALRAQFEKNFQLTRFVPVANIVCLMF